MLNVRKNFKGKKRWHFNDSKERLAPGANIIAEAEKKKWFVTKSLFPGGIIQMRIKGNKLLSMETDGGFHFFAVDALHILC